MSGVASDTVDEVLQRTDIVSLISQYVHLKKAGREWIGLCPFHEERTPSFTVSPVKRMFYCFGCQTGGSALTFLMKQEGLEFREALERLAAAAGVTLPERSSPADRKRDEQRQGLHRLLEEVARYFQQQLAGPAGESARRYLESRGIDRETRDRFRLGYSASSWDGVQRALAQRFSPAMLEQAGLVIKRSNRAGYYDRFRNRLMFPIADHRGRVAGFGGRALKAGDEPKYMNSPETAVFNKRRIWYGFDLARGEIARAGEGIVVEGYMDLIAASRAGFGNVVASLGTALSSEQVMTLSRLAPRVIIAYDADAAGVTATLRGLGLFRQFGSRVFVCRMPDGEDPDSVITGSGIAGFQKMLDEAMPLVDYRLSLACEDRQPVTGEEKVALLNRVLPVLLDIDSEVELDHYTGQVALRLGIDRSALTAEISRRRSRRHSSERARNNTGVKQDRGNTDNEVAVALDPGRESDMRAERELIAVMLSGRTLAGRALEELSVDSLSDARMTAALRAIAEAVDGDDETFVARVMARIEDEQVRSLVGQLALIDDGSDAVEVLDSLVSRVNDRPNRIRIIELQQEIADSERQGAPVDLALISELDRLLKRSKRRA